VSKGSIAARLAAMFAVAALLVFALVGVALSRVLHRELERHQVKELETKLAFATTMISRCVTREKWDKVREKLDALSPVDASTRFWVSSDDARFSYGEPPSAEMRSMSNVIPGREERPPVRLTVGTDPSRFEDTLASFELALFALCALGVLLVAVLGYRIARVGLRPIEALSMEAHALSPKHLAQRLMLTPLPPELSDLASSFNGALDRLERAYTQLEAFNADVAHELRTPLTNLVGQTQVALSKERTATELEEVLQSNLEELERMRTIINDMLFLARADQGETAVNRRPASLREELEKTVEFLELIIDEAGVSVQIAGDAQASIEVSLFRRAATNLLQNAVQHSPPGAEIVVEVASEGEGARVVVANPGDPIPEQHLPRLFDRFYRVDAARRGDANNHGLGLSIVKAVALMHGGGVFAESAAGRTAVGFTIG
jgi:two-component system, OmpR family, heavy metal sensor histidine kinase CusS